MKQTIKSDLASPSKDENQVSIIMPAYNASRYLAQSVDSVLAQSWPHWELLIVDDASSDNTFQIAKQLAARDPRIKVLQQPQNSGVAEARNTAVKEACGEYIAFLDSDDLWMPEKLEKQINFMKAHDVLVCYSAYQRIDENGVRKTEVWPPQKLAYADLLKSNFIGNLTGVYNTRILGKQYFSQFRHEDYVAWLALVKKAKIARSVNEVLGLYRVYSGSTSSNKLRTIAWQWKIYRSSESLGFFYSCWLMFCYGSHAIYKRF